MKYQIQNNKLLGVCLVQTNIPIISEVQVSSSEQARNFGVIFDREMNSKHK